MANPCAGCLCCFNKQTALCIEITIIVTSILGIIFSIWALAGIPWEFVRNGSKVLYILSLIFFIAEIAFTIILTIVRRKGIINSSFNPQARGISIAMCFIAIIGFVFILIAFFIACDDLSSADDVKVFDTDLVSNGDWANTIITGIALFIIWIINFLCCLSDCLRIFAKTSGFLTVENAQGLPQKTEVTIVDNTKKNNNIIYGDNKNKNLNNNNNNVNIGDKYENPIQYGNIGTQANDGNNSGAVLEPIPDKNQGLNMIGNSNNQSEKIDKSNSIGNNDSDFNFKNNFEQNKDMIANDSDMK